MARAAGASSAGESTTLRRYRHLLRTAPLDWQESAHRRALLRLTAADRADVLDELRRLLGTGFHIRPDDVHHVARLVVRAERRSPRILVDGFPAGLRDRLSAAVVDGPIGRSLDVGLEMWDGTDGVAAPPAVPVPPLPRRRWLVARLPQGDAWGVYCNLYDGAARQRRW